MKRGYRIKVQIACDGLHPSEVVVYVRTSELSIKHVTISRHSLNEDGTVDIGWPVGSRSANGKEFLIEMPREFNDGSWRVWVKEEELIAYSNPLFSQVGTQDEAR